jgi:hypothetical protein
VQKLEKEVEKQLQIIQVHEQQEATLLKQAAEFTCSKERVLTELGAAKVSSPGSLLHNQHLSCYWG